MIHRKYRFHGLHSLGFVMRRGQVAHAPGLALKFVTNSRRTQHRVAVVASRKVSKSAVVRNRIRRRIFEAVRQAEGAIAGPYDLVFIVRDAELKDIQSRELAVRVHALLAKSGALPRRQRSSAIGNHAIVGTKGE